MKKLTGLILIITILSLFISVSCTELSVQDIARFVCDSSTPQVASVGGEWAVIGLARGNFDVPKQYFSEYYEQVKDFLISNDGVLSKNKNTVYSRVILALTAIGKNPADVSGYNLLLPLSDFEKTVRQGTNGAIWAIIALDSKSYEIPQNPNASLQATRDMYIDYILKSQLESGAFSLSCEIRQADIDITAMALQALSKYKNRTDVADAIDRAIKFLSNEQTIFSTSENISQVIVALTSLGISPDDPRFSKSGFCLINSLMNYYTGDGGFKHTLTESTSNPMSTEQALYALVSVQRFENEEPPLYDMTEEINYISELTEILSKKTKIFYNFLIQEKIILRRF